MRINMFFGLCILLGILSCDKKERQEEVVESGCWITLYNEINLDGHQIKISDGANLNNFTNENIRKWKSLTGSLETGPDARVILYTDEDFMGTEHLVGPGIRIDDASSLPINEVASLKLYCLP